MQPQRSTVVNGHLIEEFFWNGRMVVYVDNCAYAGSYSQAITENGGYRDEPTS